MEYANPLEWVGANVEHLQESLSTAWIVPGFSNFVFWMIICWILVVTLVMTVGRKLQLVPNSKFTNMVEFGYELVRKQIGAGIIGHGYKRHIPFLATLFFFILISNVIGLIPGAKTPTGTISITCALAISSFVYFNYWGIKAHGGLGYLKSLAPSGLPVVIVPLIWLIEFISLILRVITLAVRLYGNMFAGHMVLGIFSLLTSCFILFAIQNDQLWLALPSIMWIFLLVIIYALECLMAFLQAYVFTILSAIYISIATSDH